ncbi:adenosine deaminase [Terriglobus saanensis]
MWKVRLERVDMMNHIREFIGTVPKAELHMHLEGSLEPEMLFRLAKRNKIALRWSSEEALLAAYEFENLEDFLALYFEGCRVLVTEKDFYDVTAAYLAKANEQSVRRVELFLGPQSFTERGVPLGAIMDGVLGAIADAQSSSAISAAYILSVHRHRPVEDALRLLESIGPWSEHIVGVGMGGPEVGYPPGRFRPFYLKAKALGYRTTVHAGEEGPPAYIREALDMLSVERIDHGVTACHDSALMERLAAEQTPLTVCPLSNLRLKGVPSLEAHPLKTMLDRGLRVSVHSDDPPYFGGYVNENLEACCAALSLSAEDIAALARNSFLGSFAPPDEIMHSVDAVNRHLDLFLAER